MMMVPIDPTELMPASLEALVYEWWSGDKQVMLARHFKHETNVEISPLKPDYRCECVSKRSELGQGKILNQLVNGIFTTV
jgi:hypothetical protein